MEFTSQELASKLGARLVGDAQLKLYGIAPIEAAGPGQVAFLANKKYFKYLSTTKASAVIVPPEVTTAEVVLLIHDDPYYAFAQTVCLFHPPDKSYAAGIHPGAVIGNNCQIDSSAHIGAGVVIEDGVSIGADSRIMPNCFIGKNSRLGTGCLIHPTVTIREDTHIGNNVTIHSGTTVGSDGFGYAQHDGKHFKIPQIGNVVIEDDVEIGANCAIDRAALGETRIGRGTKIDNLVQIAHNVKTGENCIIISQVGVSGSTQLGNGVILAGQVGLIGHLKIGDNVIVAAQSGVKDDLESSKQYLGSPAREMMRQKRIEAITGKLPEYIKRLQELERKIKD